MPNEFLPLSRNPVAVTVAGTRFLLPYRPAAVWALAVGRTETLAASLADAGQRETLAGLLIEQPAAVSELRAESLRILGESTGRPWWEGARLLSTSVAPEVLGRLVLAGVDAHARSVGEWCAAVYALCTKNADEKGRLRFDFSLSIPPAGYEDEWDDGDDPAEVMAAVSKLTGKR
jgi:hypothetical protein